MAAPKGHLPYGFGGGRPKKYSPEEIEAFANEFATWLKTPTHVWFKDFCLDKDINPDYMAEWAEENETFRGVYKQAKHRQESRLINGGLLSTYNSNIVKLVLSNAHAWTDKQETKMSGDAANPLAFLLQQVDGKSKDLVDEN